LTLTSYVHSLSSAKGTLVTQRVLNLGCGNRKIGGALNVDRVSSVSPDVVCDLDVRPWPFANERFDQIEAFDIIEHCADVVATMEEIYRLAAPGALVRITVPHFSCANTYLDPTHRHQFGRGSFDFFGENDRSFYTRARFKRRRAEILFRPTLVNKLVWRAANRWPDSYEQRWAWIFPAWYLYFELEALKPKG
jgi:predicted SAM-dependent methyltransferase